MNITVKTITPDIAQQMLALNKSNRALNENHVRFLMREMTAGHWKLNGDTIRLNGARLIDGQHRLEAVRRSGIPITTIVVDGLDSEVFSTIDTGKARGASDVLHIQGEKNCARLAASLRFVEQYNSGRMHVCTRYSNSDVQDLLRKYPGVRESVNKFIGYNGKFVPTSVLCGCNYLFGLKDAELADHFTNQVIRGTDVAEGSPMALLRQRLTKNLECKAKLPVAYIAAIYIKTWNYIRLGKKPGILKFSTDGETKEEFPVIV